MRALDRMLLLDRGGEDFTERQGGQNNRKETTTMTETTQKITSRDDIKLMDQLDMRFISAVEDMSYERVYETWSQFVECFKETYAANADDLDRQLIDVEFMGKKYQIVSMETFEIMLNFFRNYADGTAFTSRTGEYDVELDQAERFFNALKTTDGVTVDSWGGEYREDENGEAEIAHEVGGKEHCFSVEVFRNSV